MSLPDPIPAHQPEDPPKRIAGPVTKSASTIGGLAGAVTVVIVWALAEFAGVQLPEHVAAALGAILTTVGAWVGGWLVRPGTGSRAAR